MAVMMNFCTLFDSYYIHKGIALYLSLEKVTQDFHLYVMAFDKESYEKLRSIGFNKMTVELLDDFETPELLAVKPSRTKAEYCWTAGPSVIYHFITKYDLEDLTYLDADLFFINNPKVIFEEIGSASIALTEQYLDYSEGGKYCVQFMFFRNNKDGIGCLKWWRDRCIEWCYSRYEDGKFGDQKYLEQFEILFNNVYVVKNRGLIAPWNSNLYDYTKTAVVYQGIEFPFVFYHMHGTSFSVNHNCLYMRCVDFNVNPLTKELFFEPYALLIAEIYERFLGLSVSSIKIKGQGIFKSVFSKIKAHFRSNRLAAFVKYNLLKKKYNGHESKKI